MRAPEIAAQLEGFRGRGAGSDAERRAAAWLAGELRDTGRTVAVETFWCRPNWALAQAWHVALALAGSLVSVASPRLGGALLLGAFVFILADELTGLSPGRRLTPERASQNVTATAPDADPDRLRLVLTANYDAGRAGLVYRDPLRRACAGLRRLSGAITPGWMGWLALAIVSLEAVTVLRITGHHSSLIGVLQLPPTVALVLALAALLELSTADSSPAAGDNATGVGVAIALARALDASPPSNLEVDVLLTGAGDGDGIGLRRYLRAHRAERRPASTAIIGIAACGAGGARWWRSDGRLVPLRYGARLVDLAGRTAADADFIGAAPHAGRGAAPALGGRAAGIPSIALGCLDAHGLPPRSHQPSDLATAIEPAAPDTVIQFALLLVDAIDETLATPSAAAEHDGFATPA